MPFKKNDNWYELKLALNKFDGALWSYHVAVPNALVEEMSHDGNKRVLCSINGNKPLNLAFMHDGKGGFFLMFNKDTIKSLNLELGQKLDIALSRDESKYGMPISEEMRECLHQDPKGAQLFEALTPGKKRSLIHVINKVKSTDLRILKSLVILQHLRINKGVLDYKLLNEAFRRANQDPDSVFM